MPSAHCGHRNSWIKVTAADVSGYIHCREHKIQSLGTIIPYGSHVTIGKHRALPATAKLRPFAHAAYSEGAELL